MHTELDLLGISDLGKLVRQREVSVYELVSLFLNKQAMLNPMLQCFIEDCKETALADALILDAELSAGKYRGPLHGVPIAIKDMFDVSHYGTTGGSQYLATNRRKRRDAAIVRRLRGCGAVIVGKNNMSELAVGMQSTNRFYGDMPNPWGLEYTAGGSSGGTASAVAAGLCAGGIGSDTGGSIRYPASMCGVVGLRPTFGVVDMEGALSRAASLDTAGPMARSVEDTEVLFRSICNSTHYSALHFPSIDIGSLRVGMVHTAELEHCSHPVREHVDKVRQILLKMGLPVAEIQSTAFDALSGAEFIDSILRYEFFSLFHSKAALPIDENLLGQEVMQDLHIGSNISASQYLQSMVLRREESMKLIDVFNDVDVLISPTFRGTVPLLHPRQDDSSHAREYLLPFSLSGCPAMSIPVGFDHTDMPIGIQLAAAPYNEELLFLLGKLIERQLWDSGVDRQPCRALLN